MKKLLFVVLLLSLAAFGQNAPIPVQTFSITTSAISLPGASGTFVGTDSGATFNPTQSVDFASHNILSSDGRLSAFMGGADYTFYQVSKLMNDKMPKLSGFRLLPSLGGAFGISRVKDSFGNVQQHYSGMINAKLAYSLDSGGHWQIAFSAGALRAPYFAKGWTPYASLPFSYHF